MPDSRTARRLEQLTASFRSLGCDNLNIWFDWAGDRQTHIKVGWSDATDRPPIIVHLTGKESQINLMVLAGIEMSRRLAEERPELTFPDIVWT